MSDAERTTEELLKAREALKLLTFGYRYASPTNMPPAWRERMEGATKRLGEVEAELARRRAT